MIGVKEMRMPRCCIECPFFSGLMGGVCLIEYNNYNSHQSIYETDAYERQEYCPLIEIESED